jgi:hypothetical protein
LIVYLLVVTLCRDTAGFFSQKKHYFFTPHGGRIDSCPEDPKIVNNATAAIDFYQ